VGNEHLALSPAEGDGILIAGNYSQEAKTPANADFLARWAKKFGDTKIVHEIAVSQYQGIKMWAASGMNKKIPLFSTTFGVGNEHLALSAAEGDGILIAGNYSQEDPSPANKDFLARWAKRFGDTKIVHEIAVSQYQGIKLWAEAVKKAGSLDREKLTKTLEGGVSVEGPGGTVKMDGKTHHAALDIKVMEVKGQKLTIKSSSKGRPPSDTAASCNLEKNPNENKQFEVTI
jgi:branched-chain amino acid transport system substrate-binding protein